MAGFYICFIWFYAPNNTMGLACVPTCGLFFMVKNVGKIYQSHFCVFRVWKTFFFGHLKNAGTCLGDPAAYKSGVPWL